MLSKSKPLLIFVPGLGATGDIYEPFFKEWRSTYDIRVAMHPLDFPKKLDWDFFFRPITKAAEGKDRFTLIGHSMGGAIALAYAARHPNSVSQVIAVAPPVIPKSGIGAKGLARFRWYRRLQNLALGIRGGHLQHALRAVQVRSDVLAEGRRQVLYDWANSINLRNDLGRLKNATVLWARHEEVVSTDHLAEIRRHPNITTVIVPGSHNYLPIYPRPLQRFIREALHG